MSWVEILITVVVMFGLGCGVLAGIVNGRGWRGELPTEGELKLDKRGNRRSRVPRDSHAQAYFDGFITAEVLDDIEKMFQ